jgi:hypothetical protein
MSRTQVLITKKELFQNIFIIFRDIDQLVLALFKMKLEKFWIAIQTLGVP